MNWITSKRWFDDWDLLSGFFNSYIYPIEIKCDQLYKLISHLCTKLDNDVVLENKIITIHNPVRALTIDWIDVDCYNDDVEHKLTPEYFDLTEEEILNIINS